MLLPQDEKNQVLVSNVWIRQVSDWFHFRGAGTGGLGDSERIYCTFCDTGGWLATGYIVVCYSVLEARHFTLTGALSSEKHK